MNGPKGSRPRGLCPGYKVALSENHWDPSDPSKLKVDGAIYPSGQTPNDGRPHWTLQRALIEFKRGGGENDPFDDDIGDAVAQKATANRGQNISYAAYAFARQQRTSVFLFFVNGTKMRVTLWERGGTIFTEAFDYVNNPELLCDFLWRFSLLSAEDQGLDPTATPLRKSDPHYRLMDRIAKGPLRGQPSDISGEDGANIPQIFDASGHLKPLGEFDYVRKRYADTVSGDWPRYRVVVPFAGDKQREFLIGEPVFQAPGMVGRGTRGYIAVDVATKRLVWLKDTWRPYYEGIEPEGEILKKLHAAGVSRIPTGLCGGDLMQQTQTHFFLDQDLADEPMEQEEGTSGSSRGSKRGHDGDVKTEGDAKQEETQGSHSRVRHLSHYRLVVNEVCLPLSALKSTRQLVQVVLDCTEGTWLRSLSLPTVTDLSCSS